MVFLAVMGRGDAMSVRGKVIEFCGSLVPVVAAYPASRASIASVAHKSLLLKIKLNCNMLIFLDADCLHSRLEAREAWNTAFVA